MTNRVLQAPWRGRSATLAASGIVLAALATTLAPASAAPPHAALSATLATDRIIIKWRDSGVAAMQIGSVEQRSARLSQSSGMQLAPIRQIHDRLDVVRLQSPVAGGALRRVINRLQADPSVQYAEADARRFALADPNDPRFNAGSDANGRWEGQWYLKDPTATAPAATGAVSAWPTATGAGFIVAVLDTGVDFTHPDLKTYANKGALLPGFDFVCNDAGTNCAAAAANNTYLVANDGDGWDSDASDPGDWISAADLARSDAFFAGCGDGTNSNLPIDSTWHGTRVAGIIGALTNNGIGIAGVAPDAYILPVRVLGKCSGYISDIVAGMYWAAGLSNSAITDVATNPYPATIINMSLGASTPCSKTEQDAVTALTQAGHLVVAAAGNDGGPVGAPANCSGALSVAGLRHIGTKVGYSNVSSTGAAISIAAPAGNCVNTLGKRPWSLPCMYSIETTSNDGSTVPGTAFYTYSQFNSGYAGNLLNEGSVGTSFAAPIISGIAALMVEANINLSAEQLIARIRASATPFPVPATPATGGICHVAKLTQDANGKYTDLQDADCQCTTATCGAGMVNAVAAVAAALNPLASIVTSTDRAAIGDSVTLDGSSSIASTNHSIVAYHWTSSPSVAIADASSAKAKLVFPALRPLTVTLTVTDDLGRQDQASRTIDSVALKAGGGGGRVGPFALAVLLFVALGVILARRRRRPPGAGRI